MLFRRHKLDNLTFVYHETMRKGIKFNKNLYKDEKNSRYFCSATRQSVTKTKIPNK